MAKKKRDPKLDALELDIDYRLLDLRTEMLDETSVALIRKGDLEYVASLMRAAYGKGYTDALCEKERGMLAKSHGYSLTKSRDVRVANGT